MAVTDPDAEPHSARRRSSCPADTPGVEVVRPVPTMGHRGRGWTTHCEVRYTGVRVPVANTLGEAGDGFRIAQKRLGPGRIHHVMRWLGQMQRAFELMCSYALEREAFGGPLADKQTVQNWIADSAAEIQACRLMTLDAAHKIDQGDEARVEVSLIKFYAARRPARRDRPRDPGARRARAHRRDAARGMAMSARRAHLRRPGRGAPHGRRAPDPEVVRRRRAGASSRRPCQKRSRSSDRRGEHPITRDSARSELDLEAGRPERQRRHRVAWSARRERLRERRPRVDAAFTLGEVVHRAARCTLTLMHVGRARGRRPASTARRGCRSTRRASARRRRSPTSAPVRRVDRSLAGEADVVTGGDPAAEDGHRPPERRRGRCARRARLGEAAACVVGGRQRGTAGRPTPSFRCSARPGTLGKPKSSGARPGWTIHASPVPSLLNAAQTPSATSLGRRASGSRRASSPCRAVPVSIAVSAQPGADGLDRIPRAASCGATERTKPTTACFVARRSGRRGSP